MHHNLFFPSLSDEDTQPIALPCPSADKWHGMVRLINPRSGKPLWAFTGDVLFKVLLAHGWKVEPKEERS